MSDRCQIETAVIENILCDLRVRVRVIELYEGEGDPLSSEHAECDRMGFLKLILSSPDLQIQPVGL